MADGGNEALIARLRAHLSRLSRHDVPPELSERILTRVPHRHRARWRRSGAALAGGIALLCAGSALGVAALGHRAQTNQPSAQTASPSHNAAAHNGLRAEAPPAAPPHLPGFRPVSISAVSDSTFWVLGIKKCSAGDCTALLRTSDGGASYQELPGPPFTVGHDAPDAPDTVREIRFADTHNGWAFGPTLWSSHDGGSHWQRVEMAAAVTELEAAGAWVFALVQPCRSPTDCNSTGLMRSGTAADHWEVMPGAGGAGRSYHIAARPHVLWILAGGAGPASGLLVSRDGGRSFVHHVNPCATLPGALSSPSDNVVWVLCDALPDLLFASIDGGASFTQPRAAANLAFGLQLSAISASTAFVDSTAGRLLVSSDGGQSFSDAIAPDDHLQRFRFLGFTDESHGFAIRDGGDPYRGSELWRTVDGGQKWYLARFS
ncbi:MAG TPA: hypothetical protein VE219_01205 [Candidatus Sulfotelmatobacter sp.]|nr:hypothetical protein [Candidatus Sulfotelmatobacter sp.]